jgi:hypothetical protein
MRGLGGEFRQSEQDGEDGSRSYCDDNVVTLH